MKSTEQKRITLAGVKYAAFASQETSCFEAKVLFDGKPVCVVSNDGKGGCDHVYPVKGDGGRVMEEKLGPVREFIATLDPYSYESVGGDPLELHLHDLESVVGDLLTEWLIARDFERALAKKWLYTTPDHPNTKLVYFVTKAKVSDPDRWADAYERHHKQRPTFLHTLPRDEAFRIYREAAR